MSSARKIGEIRACRNPGHSHAFSSFNFFSSYHSLATRTEATNKPEKMATPSLRSLGKVSRFARCIHETPLVSRPYPISQSLRFSSSSTTGFDLTTTLSSLFCFFLCFLSPPTSTACPLLSTHRPTRQVPSHPRTSLNQRNCQRIYDT